MKIIRNKPKSKLRLIQTVYVLKIRTKFSMIDAKFVNTPLANHFILSKEDCPKLDEEIKHTEKVPYANAIGSIIHTMVCTRLDLAHSLGVLNSYMSNPSETHLEALIWALRY